MTEIIKNHYAILVPEKASNFHFSENNNHRLYFNPYSFGYLDYIFDVNSFKDFEILGTASEREITFDCEPFVEKIGETFYNGKPIFKDYKNSFTCLWSFQESFLSLLKSKGIDPKENQKVLIIKKSNDDSK